eukprot:TRINITY_DN8306_c0_g1_i3.p1 TRINITY_DN8306_c0_g1~~TRINITY_DN8306_c0_g1_i3.p1  ORF type:complete len:230 (+),score=23.24 TRINITY_DN8306_c0_g1_i3:98-787(+)
MHALGSSFLKLRLASSCSFTGKCFNLRHASVLRCVRPPAKAFQVPCMMYTSTAKSTVAGLPQDQNGGGRRVYVDHTFYKTKSALSMKPIKPTFRLIDNGGAAIEREGCIFLEFANASGPRQYDWNKKGIFALSVGEIGSVIGLQPGDNCEFYHDPNMGKSEQGKVRKSLRIESMADKQGFFFNLTVANKGESSEERYNMPISKSEYFIIRALFSVCGNLCKLISSIPIL